MDVALKKCGCCGEDKPKTDDFFRRRGDLRHLFRSICLICESNKNKEYQRLKLINDKETIQSYKKKHYEKKKSIIKEKSNTYYKNNSLKYKTKRLEDCEKLKDVYIKSILSKNKEIKNKDIPLEIIETKRLLIKIKRELKNG